MQYRLTCFKELWTSIVHQSACIKLHLRSKYGEIAVIWWHLLFRQRELVSMAKWWATVSGRVLKSHSDSIRRKHLNFISPVICKLDNNSHSDMKILWGIWQAVFSVTCLVVCTVLWHFQNGYNLSVSFSLSWKHFRIFEPHVIDTYNIDDAVKTCNNPKNSILRKIIRFLEVKV